MIPILKPTTVKKVLPRKTLTNWCTWVLMHLAEAALRVFRGNVQLAAQTLAHNGGSLPPDLPLSPEDSLSPPATSPSDSAGTSSASTDEDMETEAVNEILEDIPEHEEDYLDSTLEDEEMIIAEYLSYVENMKSATKKN